MNAGVFRLLLLGGAGLSAAAWSTSAGGQRLAQGKASPLAPQVVKVEVRRQLDTNAMPAPATRVITGKAKITQLLAFSPGLGSGKDPDAGGPIGYTAGYFLKLHPKEVEPVPVLI